MLKFSPKGKQKIDDAGASSVFAEYHANNSSRFKFEAWGANTFNYPHDWKSSGLNFIGNKIIGKGDDGRYFEKEFKQ